MGLFIAAFKFWAEQLIAEDTCVYKLILECWFKNGKSGWHSHMTVLYTYKAFCLCLTKKRINSVLLAQVKRNIIVTIPTLKIKFRGKVLVCSTFCSDIFMSWQKALCIILFFSFLLENIPLVTRASRHTSGNSQRSQHIPYKVQRKSQDSAEGLINDAK